MESIVDDFVIRDGKLEDLPTILEIDRAWAGENALLETAIAKMIISEHTPFLVALFKDKVVGFAGAVIRESEFGEKDPVAYITHVGLSKDFSQKGMGKMLGDQLVDRLEHITPKIRTILSFDRTDLQAFFNHLGFQRTDYLLYEYRE